VEAALARGKNALTTASQKLDAVSAAARAIGISEDAEINTTRSTIQFLSARLATDPLGVAASLSHELDHRLHDLAERYATVDGQRRRVHEELARARRRLAGFQARPEGPASIPPAAGAAPRATDGLIAGSDEA